MTTKLSVLAAVQQYNNILKNLSYDDECKFKNIIQDKNIYYVHYYEVDKLMTGKNKLDALIKNHMEFGVDKIIKEIFYGSSCWLCNENSEDEEFYEHLINKHTFVEIMNHIIFKYYLPKNLDRERGLDDDMIKLRNQCKIRNKKIFTFIPYEEAMFNSFIMDGDDMKDAIKNAFSFLKTRNISIFHNILDFTSQYRIELLYELN